jgi:hypothetical protein
VLSVVEQSAGHAWLEPHLVLGAGAAAVLSLELARGSETLGTSPLWPLAEAGVAAGVLGAAWFWRERLTLLGVLVLGGAFHVLLVAIHLARGVTGDFDPVSLYPSQGQALLDGGYPESEYPPGAVTLFALETWLGDGAARTANALLMLPFQLLCVVAVWMLRTRWSSWLAAFVALWPLNAFYWEFRFDLVPTALLLVGLLLASRDRWYEAGFVLGLGAVVKWTPALAGAALLLWLLRNRRFTSSAAHVAGLAVPILLANVPLLLWKPSELLGAYTFQNARTITAESFVYLPLRLIGLAQPGYWYHVAAEVPAWANRVAPWATLALTLAVVLAAALARSRRAAVALAGLAPVVFVLTNRIFSPQFFVLIVAALAVAAALVAVRRADVVLVAGALALATTANTVLYQSFLGERPVGDVPGWTFISAAAGVPALLATVLMVVRALRQPGATHDREP